MMPYLSEANNLLLEPLNLQSKAQQGKLAYEQILFIHYVKNQQPAFYEEAWEWFEEGEFDEWIDQYKDDWENWLKKWFNNEERNQTALEEGVVEGEDKEVEY